MLAVPLVVLWAGIGIASYWTIPRAPMQVSGDAVIAFDSEIGFVPRPRSISRRTDVDAQGATIVSYNLFNDPRGARVSWPGEQSPARPDILIVGDSFAWGHGVENQDTFASRVASELGVPVTNISMGSYGTTHALQMLQRNRDLAPKLVIYPFITDHLERNVMPCARSYYPFCLDTSHVAWDGEGRAQIAPPWSNGARRVQLQVIADTSWLDPVTWFVHGLDVAYGRVLAAIGTATAARADGAKREQALEFLLAEMAKTAKSMGSRLMVVYLPQAANDTRAEQLFRSTAKLNLPILDLSPAYQTYRARPDARPLFIPKDGHPTVEAHALIASEIAAFIRQHGLLGPGPETATLKRQ